MNVRPNRGLFKHINVKSAEQLGEFLEVMAGETRRLSPHDTGNNARSIEIDEKELYKLKGRVYTTSGYGGYLEIGTSKMGAQPYFRPAFEIAKRVLNR